MGETISGDDAEQLIDADVSELLILELGHDAQREKSAKEIDAALVAKSAKKMMNAVPRVLQL